MKKFIISDIHGNGNLYYSVMSYLENVSKVDEVILYINGDLIDRGDNSVNILLDVIERINNPNQPFRIIYLGGNHELMMYQLYKDRIIGKNTYFNDWYNNGGSVTDRELVDTLKTKERVLEVVDFISNLRLYHKFDEKIGDKNIVLSHAACPLIVEDKCDLKINSNSMSLEYLLWARKDDPLLPFRCRIGNKDYFSIVGHSPNDSKFGYYYDSDENFLNIDGGSSLLLNHYPLIEVIDGYLKILTFNNQGIISGNYFIDYKDIPFSEDELNIERRLLNNNFKIKQLTKSIENISDNDDK